MVRRVLGQLRRAGVLTSARGHAGGWRLARPAQTITIADVYRAIDEPFFAKSTSAPVEQDGCVVEQTLHTLMNNALAEAEDGLTTRLDAITIADISSSMQQGRS